LDEVRKGLQRRLQDYVRSAFPGDNSSVGVFTQNGNLSIVITGERVNLKNFWSGKWTSAWTLSLDEGAASLSGEIKIHVHYFEDGNLQMQTNKPVAATTIAFNNNAALFDKVASAIQVSDNFSFVHSLFLIFL
jgi:capping protein alpha